MPHGDDVWILFDHGTEQGWELQESLAQELERAVKKLQEDLADYLYESDTADDFPEYEPPSGYPYCGCSTCDSRELLVTVVPLVAEAAEAGRIRRPEGFDAAFANVLTKEDG
jgi:hypothetical protein